MEFTFFMIGFVSGAMFLAFFIVVLPQIILRWLTIKLKIKKQG
tara:strand:- start:2559 stop:2687 length:129 start_codon:yes stop_codon:yes gene_type:complete